VGLEAGRRGCEGGERVSGEPEAHGGVGEEEVGLGSARKRVGGLELSGENRGEHAAASLWQLSFDGE